MRTSTLNVQDMSITYLVDDENQRFWPMPFVCDALGIRLHGQLSKFHPPRYTAMKYDIAVPGRPRRTGMVCLPQPEFEFWLKTLNVQKVSPASRRRVENLKAAVFGQPTTRTGTAFSVEAAVLMRVLAWRVKQAEPGERAALSSEFEESFRTENGHDIADTLAHELPNAVASLSTIINRHDRTKTPTHMPITERVDTIIKSIVDARPQPDDLLDSDLAALLCSVELEQQQNRTPQGEA